MPPTSLTERPLPQVKAVVTRTPKMPSMSRPARAPQTVVRPTRPASNVDARPTHVLFPEGAPAREGKAVIHAGSAALWAGVTSVTLATCCAVAALADIRWLAGTFAFLVLATLALWGWLALSIVLDGNGILVGRMFGIDTRLAYRDMARVRFIRVETGDATQDWRVQHRIQGLDIPFETAHPQGRPRAAGPLLQLRIEPKKMAAARELRLDLAHLARPADIKLLYERLPRPATDAPMPIW